MPFRIEDDTSEKPTNSFVKGLARKGGQQLTSVGTSLAGLPGDILNVGSSLIAEPLTEAITGKKAQPYGESPIGRILPTSETLKQSVYQTFPSMKPESFDEKLADEFLSLGSQLLAPISGPAKAMSIGRAFGISAGATLGGEAVSQWTGDREKGALAKAGSSLVLSLISPKRAAEAIKEMYTAAEGVLPETAVTSTKKLASQIEAFKSNLQKGIKKEHVSSNLKSVLDEADKILHYAQQGEVPVNTLVGLKQGLNEEISKMVSNVFSRNERNALKNMSFRLNGMLQESLKDYGKTNPEWHKLYKDADLAFGTLKQSQLIENTLNHFLKSHIGADLASTGVFHLLTGQNWKTTAGGAAAYQTGKILYRMFNSPVLRKHYLEVIKLASEGNLAALGNAIDKLDKASKKEKKSRRFYIEEPQED